MESKFQNQPQTDHGCRVVFGHFLAHHLRLIGRLLALVPLPPPSNLGQILSFVRNIGDDPEKGPDGQAEQHARDHLEDHPVGPEGQLRKEPRKIDKQGGLIS